MHEFLRSRRSIRRFNNQKIHLQQIRHIIETATYAPSAHNRQPWRFAVISDQKIKINLSESMSKDFKADLLKDGLPDSEIEVRLNRSRERILNAPFIIILCLDLNDLDKYADTNGMRNVAEHTMGTQSVAAAGLQLQLAARAEGLDTVWTCGPLFAPSAVQKTLNLSTSWEPQAMFFVGYAAEEPKSKALKNIDTITKFYTSPE